MPRGSLSPVAFYFAAQSFDSETFDVIGFKGEEAISRPYRFEIDLVADTPDIDMEKLLLSRATLSIEKGDQERKIHGVVAECDLLNAMPDQRFHYRVVLVPRFWLLSLSRQNQIYQHLSVPDIVSHEIQATTAKGATRDASAGLSGDDFELRLTRTYASREYTVQYKESDLDFVSRLMEHEGIFYFFEQQDDHEKMVISDNNVHFAAMADGDVLAYRPASGLSRVDDEAVVAFAGKSRRVSRKMVIKDYNYRMPHLTLQGEADIDEKAHGVVCDYGEHFKTPETGNELARIRAQALYCTKQTFKGRSDCIRLSPGRRFILDEHFRDSFNAQYIITKMTHKGRQPLESTAGMGAVETETATYENRLTCIPSDVDYRPPLRTPRPVIPGLMNAHVDAAMLEKRAEIDEEGRYKLVMPFDLSGAAAGKASRYVRKAQPYGGHDMGMHFPLYKGTEVICSFVNGDPDRPIITGVVPNPLTASVVTSGNYTKNIVKTGHGSYFEFNDGKGPADKAMDAASSDGALGAQQQQQSIAPGAGAIAGSELTVTPGSGTAHKMQNRPALAMQQQQQHSSAQESSPGGGDDIWFRVDLPNYNDKANADEQKSTYLRMGQPPPDERYTMDSKSEEKEETYAVAETDQTASIACKEGNRYIVEPVLPADITVTSYEKSSDSLGVTLDMTTGVITFNVGYDAADPSKPNPETVVNINYKDSANAAQTTQTTITWTISDTSGKTPIPDGWFDFTDGDHTSIIAGNKEEKIVSEEGWFSFAAYEGIHKLGDVTRKVSLEHTSSYAAAFGDEESYFAGSQIEGFLGFKSEVALASSLEMYSGVKYETHLDWNFEFGTQGTVNLINGDEYTLVDDQHTFATEIKMHVLEEDPTPRWMAVVHGMAQLVATGVVGAAAGGRAAMHKLDTEGWKIAGDAADWSVHGLFGIGHIALLIASLISVGRIKRMHTGKLALSQLNMEKDRIELKCGESVLEMNSDGTIFIKGKKFSVNAESQCEIISPSEVLIKSLDSLKLTSVKEVKMEGADISIGKMTSAVAIKGKVANG